MEGQAGALLVSASWALVLSLPWEGPEHQGHRRQSTAFLLKPLFCRARAAPTHSRLTIPGGRERLATEATLAHRPHPESADERILPTVWSYSRRHTDLGLESLRESCADLVGLSVAVRVTSAKNFLVWW